MLKRDQELLDMLAEESAEVIQAIMKINRHGITSYHPDDPSIDNRDMLRNEIIDLVSVINKVETYIVGEISDQEINNTWNRKQKYTHFQGEQ